MVWRRLMAGLVRRDEQATANMFLDSLVAQLVSLAAVDGGEAMPEHGRLATLYQLRWRLVGTGVPDAGGAAWWEELRGQLVRMYPVADALALDWLLAHAERSARVERALSRRHTGSVADPVALEPACQAAVLNVLLYWVWRWPPPEAVMRVQAALREQLALLSAEPARAHAYDLDWRIHQSVDALVDLLLALERGEDGCPLGQVRDLLLTVVRIDQQRAAAAARQGQRYPPLVHVNHTVNGRTYTGMQAWGFTVLRRRLINTVFGPLAQADRLSLEELWEVVLAEPILLWNEQVRAEKLPEGSRRKLAQLIDQALAQTQAGEVELPLRRLLSYYRSYAGIDHFLAAARFLERHPMEKLPIDHYLHAQAEHTLGWAAALLRKLPAPTAADHGRLDELRTLASATLLTAALYSPPWAALIEQVLAWPGLAALVQWLQQAGSPGPWSLYRQAAAGEEEDEPGVLDRQVALAAVQAMGDERLRQLQRHPVARGLYRDALYYLEAARGSNAAEVEAAFLKRSKRAVRALGLLPDEDDILDRYLALRRFADEAKQFGAQRQASETMAVQSGLANLARTAGYDDLAQLEWVMEAQLGEQVDPDRTWTIGDYHVRLEASPAARVLVARNGKPLKSVPAAVRKDAIYGEIKTACAQLAAQFERVGQRLEQMMARGETMTSQEFAPALTTPAGRVLLPSLVLRLWLSGHAEPVEALDFQTLDGQRLRPEKVERFGVAHPQHLADAGTLAAWQRRLIVAGVAQPFNQLFREIYRPAPGEREQATTDRFRGRRVRLGTLVERLKRYHWRRGGEGELERACGRGRYASLWFADGAAYNPSTEILTVDALALYGASDAAIGALEPLIFSELMREVDLATAAAAAERRAAPLSPEVLAARAALVLALAPAATISGELAAAGTVRLHLGTGAALDREGQALVLPDLPAATLPYPGADSTTAEIVARLDFLARQEEKTA